MKQSTTKEEVQRLFDQTVAKVSDCKLPNHEIKGLTNYSLPVIRCAMYTTHRWLQKHRAEGREMSQNLIVRSLYGACSYQTKKAATKKPSVRAEVRPEPIKAISTDDLRNEFQSICTNAGDWTLSELDVLELLKSYSAKTLSEVFKELGRFDDNQQQECFDRLQALLDQSAWQTAMQ